MTSYFLKVKSAEMIAAIEAVRVVNCYPDIDLDGDTFNFALITDSLTPDARCDDAP